MNAKIFPLKGKMTNTGNLLSLVVQNLLKTYNIQPSLGKPMGYSFKSKKINISIPQNREKELINMMCAAKSSMNPIPILIDSAFRSLDIENQITLDTTLRYLGIYYERKNDHIIFTSQNSKLSPLNSLFFDQLNNIVLPGSYIMWKGEDGDIFGRFYLNNQNIAFDGMKEFKPLNDKFVLKKKLEKILPEKEQVLTKKKI